MKGDRGELDSILCIHCLFILTVALEFSGTLLGFDDYVNIVLEDVTEL